MQKRSRISHGYDSLWSQSDGSLAFQLSVRSVIDLFVMRSARHPTSFDIFGPTALWSVDSCPDTLQFAFAHTETTHICVNKFYFGCHLSSRLRP